MPKPPGNRVDRPIRGHRTRPTSRESPPDGVRMGENYEERCNHGSDECQGRRHYIGDKIRRHRARPQPVALALTALRRLQGASATPAETGMTEKRPQRQPMIGNVTDVAVPCSDVCWSSVPPICRASAAIELQPGAVGVRIADAAPVVRHDQAAFAIADPDRQADADPPTIRTEKHVLMLFIATSFNIKPSGTARSIVNSTSSASTSISIFSTCCFIDKQSARR